IAAYAVGALISKQHGAILAPVFVDHVGAGEWGKQPQAQPQQCNHSAHYIDPEILKSLQQPVISHCFYDILPHKLLPVALAVEPVSTNGPAWGRTGAAPARDVVVV